MAYEVAKEGRSPPKKVFVESKTGIAIRRSLEAHGIPLSSELGRDVRKVIHLQSLETKMDRKLNYLDMLRNAERTGIPLDHWYRKIQSAIAVADDAEDLISTALMIGRKIAPRLLLRAVPIVGTALLIKDILELTTMILAMTQPSTYLMRGVAKRLKGHHRHLVESNPLKRGVLKRAVSDFLGRKTGLGDLLEAAQAMDTLTDHGLRLGPIMGYINDRIIIAARTAWREGKAWISQ